MKQKDEIAEDAKRYRVLRNYLLGNGFVIHQRIPEDQEPFVLDADFYGYTFEQAVDALTLLEGSPSHKDPKGRS